MDNLQENGQRKWAFFGTGRLHSSFSKLQRASTGFIAILGFYMLLGMFFEALSPNFLF